MYRLALFFLLAAHLAFTQTHYTVLDSVEKKPVAYANVWKEEQLYTSVDSLGMFAIRQSDSKGSFKITAIGYDEKEVDLTQNTFLLQPNRIILEEIKVVRRKHAVIRKIGKASRGNNHYGVQFDAKMARCAKYFPNRAPVPQFVSKIRLFANTSDKNRVVNIVLYAVGPDGAPAEVLNSDNKIVRLRKGNHQAEADFSNEQIEFPKEGIFVAIEHLLLEQNRNYDMESKHPLAFFYEPLIGMTEAEHFIDTWYLADTQWKKSSRFSVNIQLTVSD